MGTAAGSPKADDDLLYIPVPNMTKSGLKKIGNVKVSVNEEEILLFYVKGQIHAIQEKCPHQGGPLHLGEIEELPDKSHCVKCPWHSWKFNVTTGVCIFPGNDPKKMLKVYPVTCKGEEIRLGFPRIAAKYFQVPP